MPILINGEEIAGELLTQKIEEDAGNITTLEINDTLKAEQTKRIATKLAENVQSLIRLDKLIINVDELSNQHATALPALKNLLTASTSIITLEVSGDAYGSDAQDLYAGVKASASIIYFKIDSGTLGDVFWRDIIGVIADSNIERLEVTNAALTFLGNEEQLHALCDAIRDTDNNLKTIVCTNLNHFFKTAEKLNEINSALQNAMAEKQQNLENQQQNNNAPAQQARRPRLG